MTDYQKYRNLIEGYFDGTLSPSDESALMKKLDTDSELKSEFDIQNDIVQAIRETRKTELKNRLENINIRWYHNISNGWKVAATATVITVSSLTAYYLIDTPFDINNRIDLAQNEIILDALNSEQVDIPQKPHAENVEDFNSLNVSEPDQMLSVRNNESEANNLEENLSSETEQRVEVIVPDVIEEFDDVDHMELENITSGDINTMSPSREDLHSSVEIRSVIDKKYNFHYNFKEGTLTLYGNFQDIPYEIIEINSASGKSFYLNYRDSFYHIKNTKSITPLKPVTNENLINELRIVMENK